MHSHAMAVVRCHRIEHFIITWLKNGVERRLVLQIIIRHFLIFIISRLISSSLFVFRSFIRAILLRINSALTNTEARSVRVFVMVIPLAEI